MVSCNLNIASISALIVVAARPEVIIASIASAVVTAGPTVVAPEIIAAVTTTVITPVASPVVPSWSAVFTGRAFNVTFGFRQ